MNKVLGCSGLSFSYMEGEAPQWDFRHCLENGTRRVHEKQPLPLIFENWKERGGVRTTQVSCLHCFLCGQFFKQRAEVWGIINDDCEGQQVLVW